MLDVDEFYRTGSPSINLGFAHPETRTSSIMDFKVCKANITRTQTEATVFIDWADCCCCCVLFVHSFHLVCLILCHVSCPAPVDTRFSTRTIKTSRYCGRARASPIWDTQVSSFAHFFLPILHRHIHSFISLCFCFSVLIADQIWLMSRERKDFSLEIRTIIHDALTKLGLDPERLVLSKNRNCPKTLWENI